MPGGLHVVAHMLLQPRPDRRATQRSGRQSLITLSNRNARSLVELSIISAATFVSTVLLEIFPADVVYPLGEP